MIDYKERAIEKIKLLSDDRLRVVLDFIEYIEEKEEWEATREILSDKDSMDNIKSADKDWESGKMDEFVPWEKLKRGVQDCSAQKSGKDL